MLKAGRYSDALPFLKKLRFDNPSSVEVLPVGMGLWNAERNAEGAREWLQMALTSDPQLMDAIEYLSLIAIEENDLNSAQLYYGVAYSWTYIIHGQKKADGCQTGNVIDLNAPSKTKNILAVGHLTSLSPAIGTSKLI